MTFSNNFITSANNIVTFYDPKYKKKNKNKNKKAETGKGNIKH